YRWSLRPAAFAPFPYTTLFRSEETTAMTAYVLVNVKVKDSARYEGYKRLAERAVERHGGRYLVRGGETMTLEGGWQADRVVVLRSEEHTSELQSLAYLVCRLLL